MRSTIVAFLAISTAAFLACGSPPEPKPVTPDVPSTDVDAGATTPEPAADDAGTAATTPPPAEDKGFDGLSTDKKVEVMMTKVVPNVGKEFKEFDGKKFAKFGCKTCHGDAKVKSKDDPKKLLPKLTLSNGGYEKLKKSKAKWVTFMEAKVVPAMADALGEKPFDPATKQGFSCGDCHAVD